MGEYFILMEDEDIWAGRVNIKKVKINKLLIKTFFRELLFKHHKDFSYTG